VSETPVVLSSRCAAASRSSSRSINRLGTTAPFSRYILLALRVYTRWLVRAGFAGRASFRKRVSRSSNVSEETTRRRLSVSIAVVFPQLYGGWWVREVTCPKSQRAGFQLAALDIRAAPECPPGPATRVAASRRSCR
jgi:hypothetical protein